jgi:hypothetical protein
MEAEPDGLILPAQRQWLLGARQYVCAALNRQRQQWKTPDAVNGSLFFLGDSLESACNNMSQWRLSAQLSDALVTLYEFNHRSDTLCSVNGGTAAQVDTFYYTRAPDIVVMRQQYRQDSNASTARIVSTLASAYSVNPTMLVLLVLAIFASTIMALKMVADRSANRHWLWCLNQGAAKDDEDDRVYLEMGNIERIEDGLSSSTEEEEQEHMTGKK